MNKVKKVIELEEGDVLAEPIISSYGTLLLPAGTPINQKQIKLMKMWNVKQVSVSMDLDNYNSWLTDELLSYGFKSFSDKCYWKPNNPFDEDMFYMGVVFEARKYLDDMERTR